jgi:hypothetical protein
MQREAVIASLLLFGIVLGGCAPQLTQPELDTVETVTIINSFPERPNFTIVRTTIFNNQLGEFGDGKYFEELNSVTKNALVKRGYRENEVVQKREEMTQDSDMVLTLVPRDIYQWPETNGYGAYQRTFFGIKNKPVVYVALNIHPEIHGKLKGSAYFHSVITELTIDELPEGWELLAEKEKKEVDTKLSDSIDQAVSELLGKIGI